MLEKNMEADRLEVGRVTIEERDEIKRLFERKNGLQELLYSLARTENQDISTNPIYDRLVKDMGEVSTRFQRWWATNSKKYNWESAPDCHWEIDFDSCVIFLKK